MTDHSGHYTDYLSKRYVKSKSQGQELKRRCDPPAPPRPPTPPRHCEKKCCRPENGVFCSIVSLGPINAGTNSITGGSFIGTSLNISGASTLAGPVTTGPLDAESITTDDIQAPTIETDSLTILNGTSTAVSITSTGADFGTVPMTGTSLSLSGTLAVTGTTTVGLLGAQNVTVNHSATIGQTLTVVGTSFLGLVNADTITATTVTSASFIVSAPNY